MIRVYRFVAQTFIVIVVSSMGEKIFFFFYLHPNLNFLISVHAAHLNPKWARGPQNFLTPPPQAEIPRYGPDDITL